MKRLLLKWFGITVPRTGIRVTVPCGGYLTPAVYEISWTGHLEVADLERMVGDIRQNRPFVVVPNGVSLRQVWPV